MNILDELKPLDDLALPDTNLSSPASSRKKLRPEAIMGIIAGLSAVLLLVMVILCWPYFTANEDPEAPRHAPQIQVTEPPLFLEPTISVAEPEAPTISPEKNPFDRNDFQYNDRNFLLLQNLPSSPGIDVSGWQGDINWNKVKASGIEFAFVRVGYRGYESGKLTEDAFGQANLDGAAAVGLKVGAYFFSQALTIQEVDQEINYMLYLIGDRKLDLPLVLDWEIPAANARTANMDRRTLTDLQLHFIKEMKKRGLEAMVYFNWHQSENLYYLDELEDAPFWLAMYQDRMTFPWKVEYWQYTDKGRVPGIDGPVDINVYMPD